MLCCGTRQIDRTLRPSISSATMRSIMWKVSRCMRSASGALRRDQLVDLVGKIAQHEVLVGGGLAVVDLLGPLLERQLDAEGLVDGESDIQEVEAVDFEVVDGVAFRLDVLARNIAGF